MQPSVALGLSTLNALFDEQSSKKLDGGALEAVGRLFKRSVKVYVYPNLDPGGQILTLLDPAPSIPADHLRQLVLAFDQSVATRIQSKQLFGHPKQIRPLV